MVIDTEEIILEEIFLEEIISEEIILEEIICIKRKIIIIQIKNLYKVNTQILIESQRKNQN